MLVVINDKTVTFPSTLADITLRQRIDLHDRHGRDLEKMLESIQKMTDESERTIEMTQWSLERMFRTFAFFAGTTPEAIKESEFVGEVARIYNASLAQIYAEELAIDDTRREFEFKGETWHLAPPELKHGDKMSFGEVIESKQTVKDMLDLGRGRWEAMLRLCVIYLRKKDEPYTEDMLFEGSKRMKLMEELPLDIALHVGFFLKSFLNFYQSILMFSEKAGPKVRATTSGGISSDTAGSTF